ncbi:MMPL family transporter [Cellulomonas shaoxiangyii]|uniref:RND transporter n=1 Tax=Cellulomonas shaoxiangyii TaxID=2566013 RepID=A0A4P7SKY7_9CELL|nr:MMPL family transporter [Cellulomonas shaoxiangyii]QCB94147.1 RND transporter [Cellulomonas shaoxiangyii]TGY86640.1 RND transporter [Cellulomonas shaoxiangyii]
MAGLLYRLGRSSARHPWRVIAVWLVALLVAAGAYVGLGGTLVSTVSIPGTATDRLTQRLQEELPDTSGGTGTVVFSTEDGEAFDDAQREGVAAALADAAEVDGVEAAVDPFATEAQREEQAQELAAGAEQVEQGRAELAAGQAQLDASRTQLDTGQAQLDAARTQLDASAAQGVPEPALAAGRAQLDAQQAQLDAGRAQLEAGQAELDAGREALESQEPQLEAGRTLLDLATELRQVSEDGSAALATVVFEDPQFDVTPETKDAVIAAVQDAAPEGVEVAFSNELASGVPVLGGASEAVGVAVAVVVLLVMLGSVVAAGLPLLNALIGVGVAALGTLAFSSVVEMSSVTPVLGLMLGLAVGIDYSLFLLNRHRQQLRRGMSVIESVGLATGTSGNAVVFAGSTVLIALLALNVTGVPFLGLMGTAAAASVAVAVLLAVTLTPALLGLAGTRVLPRRQRTTTGGEHHVAVRPMSTPRAVLSLLLGAAVLLVAALPAASMRLGLPDGSQEATDTTQYRAYMTTAEEFGEGANGPLLVVADLPAGVSEDELPVVQAEVGTAVADLDDVRAVAPIGANEDRTVLAFQVLPEGGPNDVSTEELVQTVRALTLDEPEAEFSVAGVASANIDVSEKLSDALPGYLALVVGLSLVILVMVFRSILVPVVATLGFVLSLLATFGAVTAVFQWGWLGNLFGVHDPGPVISFLPTIVIGILFGLAMDYQLFLTSGVREAYAHGATARQSVAEGVRAGRAVVTAAAIIMVSVFAGFVFSHIAVIRPMGFALAFGVLVDAFVVRMTIVPAVLHLAGEKAWWLPRWLDRLLPDVDVEGAKLERDHPVSAGEPETTRAG